MLDQAAVLRDLVRQQGRPTAAPPSSRSVPIALVVGAKGGVGATVVSVCLSAALSELGEQPLLVDCDLYRADVAPMCGVAERRSVADVAARRCGLDEAVVDGPGGIRLITGMWAPGRPVSFSQETWQRLVAGLAELQPPVTQVLLDAGSGSGEVRRKLWRDALQVVIVTRTDDLSVMNAYATIKSMMGVTRPDASTSVSLLVNAADDSEGEDVFRRVSRSCERFLRLPISYLGSIPVHPGLALSGDVKLALRRLPKFLGVGERFRELRSHLKQGAAA